MILSDSFQEENLKEYLSIKLRSDAFEDGIPFFYKNNPDNYYQDISKIHKILFKMGKNKPFSIDIQYHEIKDEKFLDDLVDLHKEWFPIKYNRDYFKKFIYKDNFIIFGAFLTINNIEYLIGSVCGEMISEDKFRKVIPEILNEKSWYDFNSEEIECGILHNIGVIDEYRRLKVGTRLLELFKEEVKNREGACIYLNVIIHNKSAIKFYENNSWHFSGILHNFFKYGGNTYDAKTYYYIINMKLCQPKKISKGGKIEKESKDDSNNDDSDLQEIQEQKGKGCFSGICSMLFSSNKD